MDDRSQFRHHLVDIVLPSEPYSVVEFRRDGEKALREIAERRAVAFVVGGSGHYARALLEGLTFAAVPCDPVRTTRLESYVTGVGTAVAIAEIAKWIQRRPSDLTQPIAGELFAHSR